MCVELTAGFDNEHSEYDVAERGLVRLIYTGTSAGRSEHIVSPGVLLPKARTSTEISRAWGGRGSNPRPTDYESAALTD